MTPAVESPLRRYVMNPIAAVVSAVSWVLGLAVLILLLGLVAAVPGLNLYALGVLLDASGRVARTGRILDGFPLVPLAPRVGSIALGVWLWTLPIAFVGSLASDARILHAGSPSDHFLHRLLWVLKAAVVVHLSLALAAGGRLTRFARPLRNLRDFWAGVRAGTLWVKLEEGARAAIDKLALRYHLWLGVRGFLGAAVWLLFPTLLFASSDRHEGPAFLLVLLGAALLGAVLARMPFLQARFAATGDASAFAAPGEVARLRARAPYAFLLALFVTLALSLPLNVFKIVLPPRDALWLVTPVFIVGLYPGKLLAGWAVHRAGAREQPAWWPVRWSARLLTIPVLFAYLFVLYLTQFVGEHGKGVLFEHHAFLLLVGP